MICTLVGPPKIPNLQAIFCPVVMTFILLPPHAHLIFPILPPLPFVFVFACSVFIDRCDHLLFN